MTATATEAVPGFNVRLANFEGPFDLLLQLISRHRLDITEVALSGSQTTSSPTPQGRRRERWDLDQTSQFIVVAATLLDLKAARLLPQGEVDDPEDLALLEARDLLFARLLQYRAFKQVSRWIAVTLADQQSRFPREGAWRISSARCCPRWCSRPPPTDFLAGRPSAHAETRSRFSLTHLHRPGERPGAGRTDRRSAP